jgi:hypothetical protein
MNSLLSLHPIDRIRRNHGLEHAAIHVLTARKRRMMAGYSDTNGFWLMGEVPTEEVQSAVNEALDRMRKGEHELAIHPNCGTMFVTAGAFAALAGWLSFIGARSWQDKLFRLPLTLAFATLAIIFAQPVGLTLQANITTDGVVRDLEVISIRKTANAPATHRIETRG